MTSLRALALVCTLKPSPARSSSQLIAQQPLDQLPPGVEADMGDGDAWPELRRKIAAADILVPATPTWLGHASSVAQRVLERLDAALSETDSAGRPAMFGARKPGDYHDLPETPEAVTWTDATAARNAVHLTSLLREHQYSSG
ncbi:NAD(P)H-dependent oxidoreductase [Amycolatopsis pithecellobii]|uniref:NADPH-dependent FMN reductase-like domain-containing protein n=1 Tax=Amycolatopsis pithecellobii TaxID=664692 RepID=A0A6N7YKC7_9PSEU|nr:NAD(P)H-dependent oxidoreductase [Amycolatopsis pithecellobii]MTD53365.1 hypothetical protein [Amycolatopsis pithecellobii]